MIGKTVSHYRILEKLGEGGMGVVYKAHDTKLDRLVALKFLPQQMTASAEDKARFLQEAKAISALNHPNIATIFDVDEVEGQTFLALEYIPGGTLKSKLKSFKSEDKEIPIVEALDYGIQAAEALAHAHRHQIVHRDVKTDNLMLTDEGKVKLTDFGLAKLRGAGHVTKTGTTVGTAAYMSPEQIRGEEVDHRSDIFSLGIVLYELVTSRMPFRGEFETALCYSILNEHPPLVSSLRKKVPTGLERTLVLCLEKDRERRYQSAADVARDLRKAQRDVAEGAPPASRPSKAPWVLGTVMLLLAAGGIYLLYPRPAPLSTAKQSIAVLPFKNLSDSRQDEFFADGITDDIITQLSKIAGLKVISRQAAMKYRQSSAGLKDIGTELGVSSVLEGSVRRTPGQVRVAVRLIDTEDEGYLWTENYDRPMTEIFAIQSDLAENIAAALRVKLLPEERGQIERTPTDDTEAYTLYLRGRFFFFLETEKDVTTSLDYFQQAIERDSGFALAWSGLSAAYFLLDLNWGTQPKYREQSLLAARKALSLNPALAEGYVALGLIQMAYDRDWRGAERSYERAIALNPNHWNAHREYGQLLLRTGRVDAAIIEFKRAVELEPLSLHPLTWLGWAYLEAGEHRLAIEQLQKAQDLGRGEYAITGWLLGWEYLREGSREKAREVFKKADLIEQIWFSAVSADKEQTLAIVKKEFAATRPQMSYKMACIYAHLGDKKRALSQLEQDLAFRPMNFINLKIDPYLKMLHDDPHFIALLRQYGLSD